MNRELMFAALSATNEAILRAKETSELYQTVCDAVVHGGHIRIAAALLPDASKALEVIAATSETGFIPQIDISVDEASAQGHGLAGRAFRSGTSVASNDVLQDETLRPWREHSVACGVGATLAVPLLINARTFGVFLFCFQTPGSITPEISSLLERIVENVAFALERFQGVQRQKQAEQAQERAESSQAELNRMYVALCKTNEAIMRAQGRQELFDLVCDAAVLGGRFTSTTIALAQTDDHFMKIVSTRGQNADRVRSTAFSTSADHPQGTGLTGTSFRSKQPCIKNRFLRDAGTAHWHKLAEQGGTRSGASFPLIKEGGAIGVLLFLASEEDVFTAEIVELLARLAENLSFAIGNFDHADDKRIAEERIRFLATHDALTGVPNRAMFNTIIEETVLRSTTESKRFAVLFIDLDRFKLINDSLGHSAGDQLLIEVATRIHQTIRTDDVLARLGGDEFMVLLDDLSAPEQAHSIAGRIIEALDSPLLLNGHQCRVSCSIGISLFPDDGTSAEDLVRNADLAMYEAKADGKNAFRPFSSRAQASSLEVLILESSLREALDERQLSLHYQPKVNHSGSITGVEALLRWKHAEYGDIPPAKFIPIAEASGLIIPIGRWVLETACRQAMTWQAQGHPPISVAVNLSPKQFLDDQLLSFLDHILAKTRLPANLLQLEITESMVMQNLARATSIMKAISGRQVKLAIDDFGTGYSSLSLMKHFPIDTIKIDRIFVHDIEQSSQDRAISAAIISLGKAAGMTVVAEGVETLEQSAILKQQDCHELQGFLFSRPIPADDIGKLLSGNSILSTSAPSIVPSAQTEAMWSNSAR